uniref:HotDog domain-containing protein n=1 Tax=Hirondellea gigas TaxID=1518452 RepID=A0A6A7GC35_9CRUS
MDALAANIAHEHADDGNTCTVPLHVVTATCDRIDFSQRFPMTDDLCMRGRVTWVGRSSLNVMIDIYNKANPEDRILTAQFLMVCRDPTATTSSVTVNSLLCETDEEKALFEQGAQAKIDRQERSKHSLTVSEPSGDEVREIHKFFIEKPDQVIRGAYSYFDQSKQSTDTVHMSDTSLESILMTQPQANNAQDKIFGGYLMRKAFELGRSSAYVFCGPGAKPFSISIDDIMFLQPVEIGSVIKFNSQVVYSAGSKSQVCSISVDTEILNLKTGTSSKSNRFHFTFASAHVQLRRVIPRTYEEAMDYLTGKRSVERAKEAHLAMNSSLSKYF